MCAFCTEYNSMLVTVSQTHNAGGGRHNPVPHTRGQHQAAVPRPARCHHQSSLPPPRQQLAPTSHTLGGCGRCRVCRLGRQQATINNKSMIQIVLPLGSALQRAAGQCTPALLAVQQHRAPPTLYFLAAARALLAVALVAAAVHRL